MKRQPLYERRRLRMEEAARIWAERHQPGTPVISGEDYDKQLVAIADELIANDEQNAEFFITEMAALSAPDEVQDELNTSEPILVTENVERNLFIEEHDALLQTYMKMYPFDEAERLAAAAMNANHKQPRSITKRAAAHKVVEDNPEGGWNFAQLSSFYAKIDRDIAKGYERLFSDMQHRSAALERMQNLIADQAESARAHRWVLEDMIRQENEVRSKHNG